MPIGPWELAAILFMIGLPVILGLAFAIVLILRSRNTNPDRDTDSDHATPLKILQERYARGEIDTEEFEERSHRLLNDPHG